MIRGQKIPFYAHRHNLSPTLTQLLSLIFLSLSNLRLSLSSTSVFLKKLNRKVGQKLDLSCAFIIFLEFKLFFSTKYADIPIPYN